MKFTTLSGALLLAASPALAQSNASGDAEAGEAVFNQCQTCHVVENPDGEVLAGRNAKTGPNLYGLPGRDVASVEGFSYGDSLLEVGEQGMTWDEDSFVTYVQDPTAFLRETLDDRRARSQMSFRLRSEEDAANVWAYIASLSPAPDAEGEAASE